MLRLWLGLVLLSFLWMAVRSQYDPIWKGDTPLQEVQSFLGEERPPHYISIDPKMVKRGKELVEIGRTVGPNGKRTKYISKHYVCTTCHNLVQEDPDLRKSDPAARLAYAVKKNIPFLQGTTFKGIVNRETWYNDDYVKKYGDEKIEIAHEDLRESIQLCAIECSQGRPMQDWEIEAVLAYYWSLQFSLKDLGLTAEEINRLNAEKQDPANHETLRKWLRTFYLTKSPAHFYDAPYDKTAGYKGLQGDPNKGKALYELSCLHCHNADGVSHYILDNSKLSFRHLNRMVEKDSHFSLYQIIAYGTYAIPGHRPYMPHYSEERMSKQQVEDLRAYIEQRAK